MLFSIPYGKINQTVINLLRQAIAQEPNAKKQAVTPVETHREIRRPLPKEKECLPAPVAVHLAETPPAAPTLKTDVTDVTIEIDPETAKLILAMSA